MRLPLWYRVSAVSILAANMIVYALRPGGEDILAWASSLLPIVSALLGVLGVSLAVFALKAWDRAKWAWILLAVGVLLGVAGEVAYMVLDTVMGVNVEELGATAADAFWMLAYAPYLASLLLLVTGYRESGLPMGKAARYLVLLAAACAVAILLSVLVLAPIFDDAGTGALSKIVYAYYPIADFILLVPAGILIAITAQFGRGTLSVPWKLIAAAFVLWAGADIVYSWMGWNGLYANGSPIDLAWNLAYLLIGAAGLSQRAILVSG